MKPPISSLKFSAVALLLAGLTSCQSSYLLKEDFSADVIGNPPAKDIVGDPPDDTIDYPNGVIPRLKIQASVQKTGGKALVFSEASLTKNSPFDTYLAFEGQKPDLSKDTRFEWTAMQHNSAASLLIDLRGPQGMWLTRMYLQPDGQLIRIADVAKDLDNPQNQLLCTVDVTKPHLIVVTLNAEDPKKNKSKHTYTIGVFNTRDGSTFNQQDLPVLFEPSSEGSLKSDKTMTLSFNYVHGSSNAEAAYIYESLYISQW